MLVPVEQAGTHRTGTGGARRGMSAAASITVRVPLAIRRRLGWRTVVTPAQEHVLVMATRADPALAWAFRYQKLLDEGRYASISEMAAERIERGHLGSPLGLTLLALMIVEGVLDSKGPSTLGLRWLLEPLPMSWVKQQAVLNSGEER